MSIRYSSPVGTQAERDSGAIWPAGWYEGTHFAQYYEALTNPAYHTGVDLNLPAYADSGAPVYAIADGEVVATGAVSGWQGVMICVRHPMVGDPDAPLGAVWSRSAHLKDPRVGIGQIVTRGQVLGFIGEYLPAGPVNDHLHFDIARIDLGLKPGDWPGMDKARLLRDYYDPGAFIKAHQVETNPKAMIVETIAQLNVRLAPFDDVALETPRLYTLPAGVKLNIVEQKTIGPRLGAWGRFAIPTIDVGFGPVKLAVHGWGWVNMAYTKPVNVEPPITFTATPPSIVRGASARLDWATSNVEAVYLDNQPVDGEGPNAYRVVTPTATTTYTLRVVQKAGLTVSKTVTVTVTPPPVVPPSQAGSIGVHCIGDVASGRDAVNRGCPMVTVMSNYDVARELADRGVLVLYREYMPWQAGGAEHAVKVREAARGTLHPNIIHLPPYNECDYICYGTPDQIAVRGQQEATYVRAMRGWGAKVAIGGFSVGCPDYTTQAICDKIREYYAPLYNDDDPNDPHVFLSYHGYSARADDLLSLENTARALDTFATVAPDESRLERKLLLLGRDQHEAIVMTPKDAQARAAAYDPIWLETRYAFAYTKCGFRPDKLYGVVEDEGGVDEGGIGGYRAHNYPADIVARHVKMLRVVKSRPIVVNGKTYPSPWLGATLFMYGQDGKWSAGFDCRPYVDVIKAGVWA